MAELLDIPVHVLITAGVSFEYHGEILKKCTYQGKDLGITLEEIDGEVTFKTPFNGESSVVSLPREGLLAINICKILDMSYVWGNYIPGSAEPSECNHCCNQTVYGNQICQSRHE